MGIFPSELGARVPIPDGNDLLSTDDIADLLGLSEEQIQQIIGNTSVGAGDLSLMKASLTREEVAWLLSLSQEDIQKVIETGTSGGDVPSFPGEGGSSTPADYEGDVSEDDILAMLDDDVTERGVDDD